MTRRISSRFRTAAGMAEDLLFPRRCPLCDQPVRPFGALACPDCAQKVHPLDPVRDTLCAKCGKPLHDRDAEYCADCAGMDHLYRRGCAAFRYRDVSGAIYRFKYEERAEYADWFGEKMTERFQAEYDSAGIRALIPVPLSRARLRRRGYNQAAFLAEAVSRGTGVPVREDLLFRCRSTEAMRSQSRDARLRNLKNAFIAVPSDVKSERYVLVDDIYTTGATMDACAAALLRAGAADVYFITLAIGESPL